MSGSLGIVEAIGQNFAVSKLRGKRVSISQLTQLRLAQSGTAVIKIGRLDNYIIVLTRQFT